MARYTTICVTLFAVAGSAIAENPDLEFAQKLFEELGHADLAIECLENITKNETLPAAERRPAHAALADIYMKLSDRDTTGPALREECQEKAAKELERVRALGGEHADGHDLETRVAGILRDKALRGKAKAEAIGVTPEEKVRLHAQAREDVEKAIEKYQTIREALKRELETAEAEDLPESRLHDKKHSCGMAWFMLLRSRILLARVSGAKEKKTVLDALPGEIDEFISFFSGWGFEFYAALLKADVHKEAGRFEQAIAALDSLIEALNALQGRPLQDVVRMAWLQKAETYAAWAGSSMDKAQERGQQALDTVAEFFRIDPAIARPRTDDDASRNMKHQFQIAEVVALTHMERRDRALELAREIFEKGSPSIMMRIRRHLQELKDVEIARVYLMKADGLQRRARELQELGKKDPDRKEQAAKLFRQAIDAYRAFVRIATERDILRDGITAWHDMSVCYYHLEDYPSAAVAFGELAQTAHLVAKESRTARERARAREMEELGLERRIRCLSRIYHQDREKGEAAGKENDKEKYRLFSTIAESDLQLWQDSMLAFAKRFEKSSRCADLFYYIADTFRRQKEYDRAVEWYEKVPEKLPLFDDARYMIPVVMWMKYGDLRNGRKAGTEEARKLLEDILKRFAGYLARNEAQRKTAEGRRDEKLLQELRANASRAEITMAQAGTERREMDAAGIIDALDGFETRYPGVRSDEVVIARVRAWDRLGDFECVEKAADDLRKAGSKHEKECVAIAANLCIRKAKAAAGPAEKMKWDREAAGCFERLLTLEPDQPLNTIEGIGDHLCGTARAAGKDAADWYGKAAAIYLRWLKRSEEDPKEPRTGTNAIYFKVFSCYIEMEKLEEAARYLDRLLADEDCVNEWYVRKARVRILYAGALRAKGEERKKEFTATLRTLAKTARKLPKYDKEWWWCKLKTAEAYMDMSRYDVALGRIEFLEDQFRWGSLEQRTKVGDLMAAHSIRITERRLKNRWNVVIENLRKPVEIPEIAADVKTPSAP